MRLRSLCVGIALLTVIYLNRRLVAEVGTSTLHVCRRRALQV